MNLFNIIRWVVAIGFTILLAFACMSIMSCGGSKKATTKSNIDSAGTSLVNVSKYDSAAKQAGISISQKGNTVTIDSGNTTIEIDNPEFKGNGANLFDVLVKAEKVTIRDNRRQSVKTSSITLSIDSTKGFVKSRVDSTVKTITKVKKQDVTIQAEKKKGFPWWMLIIAAVAVIAGYFVAKNAL